MMNHELLALQEINFLTFECGIYLHMPGNLKIYSPFGPFIWGNLPSRGPTTFVVDIIVVTLELFSMSQLWIHVLWIKPKAQWDIDLLIL